MKPSLNGIWVARLTVGLAALGLLATAANAQGRFEARFTLPCETNWNGKTLPAGEYTLDVPSLDQTPYIRVDSLNGNGRVYIPSSNVGEESSKDNVIVLTQVGDRCEVREVNLAAINEDFIYKPMLKTEMASLGESPSGRLLALHLNRTPAAPAH